MAVVNGDFTIHNMLLITKSGKTAMSQQERELQSRPCRERKRPHHLSETVEQREVKEMESPG